MKRYFIVFYTANANDGGVNTGAVSIVTENGKYVSISEIDKSIIGEGNKEGTPTNIIELSESDFNDFTN